MINQKKSTLQTPHLIKIGSCFHHWLNYFHWVTLSGLNLSNSMTIVIPWMGNENYKQKYQIWMHKINAHLDFSASAKISFIQSFRPIDQMIAHFAEDQWMHHGFFAGYLPWCLDAGNNLLDQSVISGGQVIDSWLNLWETSQDCSSRLDWNK